MMKKVVLMLIAVMTLSLSVCSAAITKDDFTIAGINLLTNSYDDVLAVLGEPDKKTVDEQGEPALTYLTYKGLKVWTINRSGQIAYIYVDGRDYETPRGIKVGATPYKVAKEYGEPQKQNIRGHVYYVYKTSPESASRMLFDLTEGYVSRIILTSLPVSP